MINGKETRVNLAKLCSGIAALIVVAAWTPSAMANPNFSGCTGCHPAIANFGPGHAAHATAAGNDCNSCHVDGVLNNPPIGANCTRCHGRVQDAGGDSLSAGEGRGLRLHHQNGSFATCSPCHSDSTGSATAGAPESTLPAFYPGPSGLNPCDGSEELFASNSVSLDNDGDLLTDGADPDCAAPVEICTDGIDNDSDGMVDCDDTDCSADPACQPEADCNDGVDNDGDGMIDCDDQDCAQDPACQAPQTEVDCADGVDNDSDGMIDCADPDCNLDPACQTPGVEICTDDIDNDGDGMTDCDDPDCSGDAACQAPTLENCTDGVDNDGDGMIDCDDQDCANDPSCQQPVMEDCDDGIDNDSDGFVDCADPDCSADPACSNQETCPSFNPPGNHTVLKKDEGCEAFHAPGSDMPYTNNCTVCHGSELTGSDSGGSAPSCYTCHGKEWDEMAPGNGDGDLPLDHTEKRGQAYHKPGLKTPFLNGCTSCHEQDLTGDIGPSCYSCHKMKWKDIGRFNPPPDHTEKRGDNLHKSGLKEPFVNGCTDCHGSELTGTESGGFAPSCFTCHSMKWKDGERHSPYKRSRD